MKLFLLLSLLGFTVLQEGASTHLETCTCNEITELINTTVQQATARLEYKINLMINTAISNINMTNDDEKFEALQNDLTSTMETLLKPIKIQLDYHLPLPPIVNSEQKPAKTCKTLYDDYPHAESGYYWIGTQESPVKVYCNMNAIDSGDLTGGWMRVAYIDMRNTNHQCPSGLSLLSRSSAPRRVCDITVTRFHICVSNSYTAHGVGYSHVYGRIIAYQKRAPVAFRHITSSRYNDIEEPYVYGVSLTHGKGPRRHIWTFAGASDETSNYPIFKCPCINTNISSPSRVPDYVGSDYFCDTALNSSYSSYPNWDSAFYPLDPLWDGEGCGPTNVCCSFNHPPWFVKDLSSLTTDDIEMRYCKPSADGSTPIEIVELYVQ